MTYNQLENLKKGTTLYYITDDDKVGSGKLENYDPYEHCYVLAKGKWELVYREAKYLYPTFSEAKEALLAEIKQKLEEVEKQRKAI